jgi:Type II secretion system (T2SS), protein M subtype b
VKALYSVSSTVSWSRVAREHRAALIPLAIALGVNVVLLLVVVLPLVQRAKAYEDRASAAARVEATAASDFRQAEAVKEGKTRASADLETFYHEVLPADLSTARRITHVRLQQLAKKHDVLYERSSYDEEEIRDSRLRRLTATMTLAGDYDDIRQFIYELERDPAFVVIDNVILAEQIASNAPLSLALELSTYFLAPTPDLKRTGNGR